MEFNLSPEIEEYRRRVRTFVNDKVLPLESDPASYDGHENFREDLLAKMREMAKSEGLWAFQMPKSRGGQDVGIVGMASLYEEMNRSIFGPACFNSAAPDDGNMILLNKVGTEAQKEQWLQPIVDGKVRSSFVMTEPHPGSGSDPSGMMLTRATRMGDAWTVKGRKWFITGADGAKHFILLARTSDDPRKGLTAFLYHADQPGWRIERRIPIMGPEEHGGHCEIEYDGLEIDDSNRLMAIGDGLKATQIRLGTARLTHCMRWLGLSKRTMEIAREYIRTREAFGGFLGDRESVQHAMGKIAMDIQVGRLLVMNAAWKLDQGDFARKEVSMAKIAVADTLHHAVDTAIQLNGARGYSKDTVLEWIYRYARQARLVDGASEVHQMVLSGFYSREGNDFWRWVFDMPDWVALETYLAEHVVGFAGPIEATAFSEGQSNPTYLLKTPGAKYVLRKKPDGELLKSAHAIDREFRVQKALWQTNVPVARVLHLCEDASVLGTIFYVMDFADGRIFWDPALPDLKPAERDKVYDETNRVLAAIHNVDVDAVGLGHFGRPDDYFGRKLRRWSGQYRETATEDWPEMDQLISWLEDNLPQYNGQTSLVHGDFRIDNLLFERDGFRVKAVFDWELSTLGHPLADVAYQIMQRSMGRDWHLRGLSGLETDALGIPSEEEYVAAYCRRRGVPVLENLAFAKVFSFFRFAAICHGVGTRARAGTAASPDAERVSAMARPLARLGVAVMSGQGTGAAGNQAT